MAVAFRSLASTTWTTSTTVAVTKPSGLAVGDLMVGMLSASNNSFVITPPSGFTLVTSAIGNIFKTYIYYKFATSSDVAATNFTFTSDTSGDLSAGIMAFTGASVPQPVYSNNTVAGNTGTTITITGINVLANSILVMSAVTENAGGSATGFSGYAIVTSNPTWTEGWDYNRSNSAGTAAAYSSVRSAATATGNATISVTGTATIKSGAIFISIPPDQSITQTDTVTTSETITYPRTRVIAQLDIVTTSEPTVTSIVSRAWTNVTRNIKSWINTNR